MTARLADFPASVTEPQAFRALARAKLFAGPRPLAEGLQSPSDYDLNLDATPAPLDGLMPAAVLVPVLARAPLTVLLTERSGHLKAHAGQIAFPGGKIEAGDAGPLAAALREVAEEIGLPPDAAEPLGYLDPYRTATGFLITPVVALVQPDFRVTPDPEEVTSVFGVPLAFLMDSANHTIESRVWRGEPRRFYAMAYEQRYIWGATAGIIRALSRRLFTA